MPARMRLRGMCAVAVCAALLGGGALALAGELVPNPVSEPDRTWAFRGFALHPPPGGKWFSLMKSPERVVFARRVPDASYGIVAVATTERLAQRPVTAAALLAHVRERRPQAPDPSHYDLTEHTEALESEAAPWCVRYRLSAEDSRDSYFYPHIVRIVGRACLHPEAPGLLVDASYAEWAIEGADRAAVRTEGDAFLAGLRLTGLRNAAALAEADALAEGGADAEAIRLLAPLAEHGDAEAALRLGMAYERGRGVASDGAQAARWYGIAADAGEVDALYNLGALHARDEAPARDVPEAIRWFRRAADQRDPQAQLNLGLLYYKGDGVPPDRAAARAWLEFAAANGSARARALLGELALEPASASTRP
ncbi:MAG: sel1 repeat family protein [Burkholderiales bacterium]|nr:sel1 repeat family protein [Burkholderiales bacterium]